MTRFASRALRFLSLAAAHALLASSVHPAAKISRVLHLPEPARALSKAHRPVVRSKAQPPVHRDLDHAGIRKRANFVRISSQKRQTPKSRSRAFVSWNKTTAESDNLLRQLSKSCFTAS